jgi:hypothetical protein
LKNKTWKIITNDKIEKLTKTVEKNTAAVDNILLFLKHNKKDDDLDYKTDNETTNDKIIKREKYTKTQIF